MTLRPIGIAMGLIASWLAGCASPAGTPASLPASGLPTAPPRQVAPLMAAASEGPVSHAPPLAPTPRPAGRVAIDFADTPIGQAPASFIDVKDEGSTPDWVYRGNWKVTQDETGKHVFTHDDVRPQPALSFMRYRGALWGQPDGRVPDRYYAECVMRPIASPDFFPPTGDQGVQFYFLDVENYLEVVIKPSRLEVWEARAAVPGTTQGWTRLWMQPMDTHGGDRRRIGARVDVNAGTFDTYLDGHFMGRVASPLIKPQPAWVTLRGTGNTVGFEQLVFDVPPGGN